MGTWKCLEISTCYILLGLLLRMKMKAFALLTVLSHLSKQESGAGVIYAMMVVVHVPLFSNVPLEGMPSLIDHQRTALILYRNPMRG